MPSMREGRFGASIDDVIIVPLVLAALGGKNLLHVTLSILTHIVDYAFPIFLRLMRFPLFTARIIGDGFIEALKFIVMCLPVSHASRRRWREAMSRRWWWLRQKMSYKAFEEAVHHAFEDGMAWVFRKCRNLTPRGALLTIGGAALWLPASFGAATALHMALIAKAASLPAWMQLLHPLATVIAKSKLLVLPVYPAAWPQAKRHASVQAIFQFHRAFMRLHLIRKTVCRYRQTAERVARMADGLGRAVSHAGITHFCTQLLVVLNSMVAWTGETSRAAMTHVAEAFSTAPLVGALLRRYAARYEDAKTSREEKFSERVRGFFERWSIKFSAEYYEAKEREQAAQRQILTQAEINQP
jgi:hypothetical protein